MRKGFTSKVLLSLRSGWLSESYCSNGRINAHNMGKRDVNVCHVLFSRSPALKESTQYFQIDLSKQHVVAMLSLSQPSLAQGREILIFKA